jgi:hypothetical protein
MILLIPDIIKKLFKSMHKLTIIFLLGLLAFLLPFGPSSMNVIAFETTTMDMKQTNTTRDIQ